MNASPFVTPIPWAQAYDDLKIARPGTAGAFNAFYSALSDDERQSLQVVIAEYPYADKIVDDGSPYWPIRTKIPDDFIASKHLPFGFVLTNYCEVSNYLFTTESLEQISDTLIKEGGSIGLFEIADCLSKARFLLKPDWHITAGAATIDLPVNFGTQQNRTIIERRLGETPDPLTLRNASSVIEQLFALEIFNRIRSAWTVRVLFFSRSWFSLLISRGDLPAANDLRARLINRSWKTYAPMRRQKSNRLREYLNEAVKGGGNQRHLGEPAVLLFASLEDIAVRRRPFFIPLTKDCKTGPFGAICEEILKFFAQECWVLAPEYMSDDCQVGYLRLDHASPAIVNGPAKATKDKVIEIMSILRAAALAARRRRNDDRPSFDLQPYVDLLPRVMFQSPATRSHSTPAQGPSVFKIYLDDQLRRTALSSLTQQQFFDPHFKVIPRERSTFFRNSLRISMNPG